jgi:hypothetical protein
VIKLVYEIIKEIKESKDKKEVLRKYPQIKPVLKLTYDPNIKFYYKAFPTNYRVPDTLPGISHSHLWQELKRLYIYQKDVNTNLTKEKRDQLFLRFLESMEPADAQIVIDIFNKNLKCGLNIKIINEVFPNLIPETVNEN